MSKYVTNFDRKYELCYKNFLYRKDYEIIFRNSVESKNSLNTSKQGLTCPLSSHFDNNKKLTFLIMFCISPRFLCRPTTLYIFARAVERQSAIYTEHS